MKEFGKNEVYALSEYSDSSTHGQLVPFPNEIYYIFRDEHVEGTLIYRFKLSNPRHLDWNENDSIEAFNSILSSFEFMDNE